MDSRDSGEDGRGVSKELRMEDEGERLKGWKTGRMEDWKDGRIKLGRVEGDIHFIRSAREKGVGDMVVPMANFIERCSEVS